MNFETRDTSNLRKTSDATNFPWLSARTPFIFIDLTVPQSTQVQSIDGKINTIKLAKSRQGECILLAVWPGQYRSDVFIVDDYDKALTEIDRLAQSFGTPSIS